MVIALSTPSYVEKCDQNGNSIRSIESVQGSSLGSIIIIIIRFFSFSFPYPLFVESRFLINYQTGQDRTGPWWVIARLRRGVFKALLSLIELS
jgi:hypothetical protein